MAEEVKLLSPPEICKRCPLKASRTLTEIGLDPNGSCDLEMIRRIFLEPIISILNSPEDYPNKLMINSLMGMLVVGLKEILGVPIAVVNNNTYYCPALAGIIPLIPEPSVVPVCAF
jgi:hypothetical protein